MIVEVMATANLLKRRCKAMVGASSRVGTALSTTTVLQ